MDPLTILESKDIIKKNMDSCANIFNNPNDEAILILAKVLYNTNSMLDALIEDMIKDQIGRDSHKFTSFNPLE